MRSLEKGNVININEKNYAGLNNYMIEYYLIAALDRLFSEKSNLGFWDAENNRITEKLSHDKDWNWNYKPYQEYRYSTFCLGMILLCKEFYELNTFKYDDKMKKFLLSIKLNENNFSKSDITYGALLSLVLGEKIYKISLVTEQTKSLFNINLKRLLYTNDNQDFLLLLAAKYFQDLYPSKEIPGQIKNIQNRLINSLNKKYYFETGDIRASYHQRILYTLWGLIFSSSFSNYERIKTISKELIDYFYRNRRLYDNAFLWHPVFYFIKYHGIKIPLYNSKSSKYLFECHQTFFVNSINFYRYFFNDNNAFDNEKKSAMEWIFGKNRNGTNLVDLSGISVPNRIMNLDGDYFIGNQNFKGSYEIGSYIFALSSFVNSAHGI